MGNIKLRTTYFFILGMLFWISASVLLWIFLFKDYSSFNQWIKLDTDNIISSLKNTFNSTITSWTKDSCEQYWKFDTVWSVLDSQYFDKDSLDKDAAIDSALKWFVDSIWDPYTVYFDKQANESFAEGLKWESDFEWIWAVVSKNSNWIVLEEIIKDSPAYKAGLQHLDAVIEIDWESTENMTLTQAVEKMRWPKWSSVKLKVYRESDNQVLEVDVVRDVITISSVSGKVFNVNWKKVWYIEIATFGEDTLKAFQNVVQDLKEQTNDKLDWIILDVRWNWWWYFETAIDIASYFIPAWKTVVSAKYRIYQDETHESKWFQEFEWIPLIVLIDWLSASSSEILAAALHDSISATLLWKNTFGKGSIQTIYDMPDGSSIKYTIGKWYTPKWENIDHEWIAPDVQVDFDVDKYKADATDSQLEAAKQQILKLIK